MTTARETIKAEYKLSKGDTIQDAGKFEGEYLWAPYWYEASLDGCDEPLCGMETHGFSATLIHVSEEDRAEWPEIEADTAYMLVEETSGGFVSVAELTEAEAETARAEAAEEEATD